MPVKNFMGMYDIPALEQCFEIKSSVTVHALNLRLPTVIMTTKYFFFIV
jgi:hypothetical protein